MSRAKGTVIAGAIVLALMLGSPSMADPGTRKVTGEGWLATAWSWVASWAEAGLSIDPSGQPTADEGPMIDPNGQPTTDDGPMSDPNG